MASSEGDDCCICKEPQIARCRQLLPCGHIFHSDCLVNWFLQGRVQCPCCRRIFGEEVGSSEPETLDGSEVAVAELPNTPESPYWTKLLQPQFANLSRQFDVLKWISARIKERSRSKVAPASLKLLFKKKDDFLFSHIFSQF